MELFWAMSPRRPMEFRWLRHLAALALCRGAGSLSVAFVSCLDAAARPTVMQNGGWLVGFVPVGIDARSRTNLRDRRA